MNDRDAALLVVEARAIIEFNRAGIDAVAAIADHRPIDESLTAVCHLVETTLAGSRCAIVRPTDDDLVLASPEPLPATLATAMCDCARQQWADDVDGTGPAEPMADPTAPESRVLRCDAITGLTGAVIGTLCVAHDWPPASGQNTMVLDHAHHLAKIALEQRLVAADFSVTVAAERELIANRLHDDPIQAMTVLSLMLQRLSRDAPDELYGPLTESRERADDAIDRLRSLLRDLHPAGLAEDGLSVAIEVALEEAMEPLGIAWTLDDTLDQEPDAALSLLAFRLTHEALANVAAHADAASVSVTVRDVDNGIEIEVTDDGRGFEPASLAPYRSGHLGLTNVQYLARRNAGRFEVASAPGNGCTVSIWLPR